VADFLDESGSTNISSISYKHTILDLALDTFYR
jgi:hypothetical protein